MPVNDSVHAMGSDQRFLGDRTYQSEHFITEIQEVSKTLHFEGYLRPEIARKANDIRTKFMYFCSCSERHGDLKM